MSGVWSKPTFPSPWRIDGEARIVDANGATVAFLAARFAGEEPEILAEIGSLLIGAKALDPAAEALRAAAPDLYEALASVLDLHDNMTAGVSHMSVAGRAHYFECWERARCALRKAREGAAKALMESVRSD